MKDATQFRERFKRWKSGELVYDKGRPIDPPEYSVGSLVNGIYANNPREEYLGEPSHHYDFTQSEEWADAHGYYPDTRGHRDDRVKKPAHPSHPSRGTWSGDKFELTDLGIQNPNYTLFGLNDGGQDPQAILTYKGSIVLPEITVTPKGNYIRNPYDNINIHLPKYADGKDDDPIIPAGMLKEVVVTAPRRYFKEYDNNGNPVYTSNYRESLSYLNSFLPKGDIEKRRERWYAQNVGSNGQQRPGLHGYAADIATAAEIGIGGALAPVFLGPMIATAAPAIVAGGDALAGTTLGKGITALLTNPYFDAATTSLGGAHAAHSIANGEADAMTALELMPMFRVLKPIYQAGKAFVGPAVESANASQTMEQLEAAYAQAVAKGNEPEALRILEQAYLRSGVPLTEITMTPEGRALGWFHGSEWGNHTVFDSSLMNATIGGTSAAGKMKGNFLTTDFPSAARYAGSGRWDSLKYPETTAPATFMEKVLNLFGRYKPRTLYPAERLMDYRPKPERLFDTRRKAPIEYLNETDRIVYPMYVNPGNNPMILDFRGNPWSKSPVEFPHNFYLKRHIRDDAAKTYRDLIIPFDSKEEAMAAWEADPINVRRGSTDLEGLYFDEGIRYIEGFNSAPRYETVKLVEERVPNTTNGAVQTAAREGNTSVLMKNVIDSNGGPKGVHYAIDDFVTLEPEQMKIADITYDDNGNLIPLSLRFQWTKKDSRYSLIPWILGGSTAATLYNNLDEYKNGKDAIHINPRKRGTFTKAALSHGMSVQGFASKVLANKDNYSSAMVKKANFARNARKFKH